MFIYQKPESYYLHTDRLGSGSAVTDGRGEAVHVLGYMPYGETLLDLSQGYETPYQFTGYEKDQETGLLYAGARYYDSRLSIFNSTDDPMWYKYPYLSPYAYCADNPVLFIDPDGREKVKSLNPNKKSNSYIDKAAENYPKNAPVIHLWAHGNSQRIQVYDNHNGKDDDIMTKESFVEFMRKNSEVWRNNHSEGKNDFTIVVLHSCYTGKESDKQSSIARKISEIPNTMVVAPNESVIFGKDIEYGPYTLKDNGELDAPKQWIMYYNGEKVNSFSGKEKPIFKNPQKIEQKYKKEASE